MRNRVVGSAYRNGMTDGWLFHATPLVHDPITEQHPWRTRVVTPSETRFQIFVTGRDLKFRWRMGHATLEAARETADTIMDSAVTINGIYDRKTRVWHDHARKGEAA